MLCRAVRTERNECHPLVPHGELGSYHFLHRSREPGKASLASTTDSATKKSLGVACSLRFQAGFWTSAVSGTAVADVVSGTAVADVEALSTDASRLAHLPRLPAL